MSDFLGEIAEVEKLLSSATFPGVKIVLQNHLQKLKTAQENTEKAKVAAANVEKVSDSNSKSNSSPATVVTGAKYIPIEDYAWDQGEYGSSTVSIFVELPGVGTVKDQVEASFDKTGFDLKIHGLNGKNYRLLKDNLEKDIVPDKSKFIVKQNKIVLKLQKVKGEYSYEHWSALTAKKRRTAEDAAAKKDPTAGGCIVNSL